MTVYWVSTAKEDRRLELQRYLQANDVVVFMFDGCFNVETILFDEVKKEIVWYAVAAHCHRRSVLVPFWVEGITIEKLAQLSVQYARCLHWCD
jgi:hypothetical protein